MNIGVEVLKESVIRVQSQLNDWMDCVFIVSKDDEEKAREVLKKAWDSFWEDGDGWCYGNYLEDKLVNAGIAFDAYYAGLKMLLDKAEEMGWNWEAYIEPDNRRTYVEIGQSSPAGEDFSMVIDFDEENQADSFKDSLESYYEDFDIDEHIEMWIEAKRSGTSGVPSTRELVKDAEAIDGMILELSQALQKVNIPVLVGSYTPPDENGEGEKIVREFYGQGHIFKDEDAFYHRPDDPCYIPELSDTVYTRNSILQECNQQDDLAEEVFEALDWQHVSSLLEDWQRNGELDTCKECGKMFNCYGATKCPYCGADYEGGDE